MFKFSFLFILTINLYAGEKKICGSDNRIQSFEEEIGRASSNRQIAGCTVTMISSRCAIGAGHCVDDMEVIQFNVPKSINSTPIPAKAEDIYLRNKDFLRYANNGVGDDWAVIILNSNELTGKMPGDVQGHLELDGSELKLGDKVRVTGHGVNDNQADLNLVQQSSTGAVKKIGGGFFGRKSILGHDADTTMGTSGAPIIKDANNKIVGVHTDGSCGRKTFNQGTLISKNKTFLFAINQCLNFERNN